MAGGVGKAGGNGKTANISSSHSKQTAKEHQIISYVMEDQKEALSGLAWVGLHHPSACFRLP